MAYISRTVQNARRRATYARLHARPRKPAMPKAEWAARNRAARAWAGICRDCPRSCVRGNGRQTVLCAVCSAKGRERRPEALEAFNAMKQELRTQARAHFYPLRDDRRQNGKPSGALAWALESRRA